MGWLKKIGLAFLALIVLGLIFGENPDTATNSSNDSTLNATSSASTALATKSPAEMMPSRDDLSTEWAFPGDIESKNATDIESKAVNATGFEAGAVRTIRKQQDVGATVLIYRFDSVNSANSYYQGLINAKKNKGGYKELSTRDVKAACYAGNQQFSQGDKEFIYCTKSNVVFHIEAIFPYSSDYSDDLIALAKIIPPKIN